jgi:hypothetical protein
MSRMNRSLIAFLLAGLVVGVLFTILNCLSAASFGSDGIVVNTTKDANIDQAVQAIDGLNLNGVHVTKISHLTGDFRGVVWMLVSCTVGFLAITGLVLFFYKMFCRWFGAAPHL